MNSDKIQLTLGDWQWNAALVGFINIVGEKNIRYIRKDTIEFSEEVLDGFQEKYFAYFINTYEKTLSWYRIVSFDDRLKFYEDNGFEEFDLKALRVLNNYIKDVKRYIKSNSYRAVYDLVSTQDNILVMEKELATIKEPKNQEKFEESKAKIISEIRTEAVLLRNIIDYCNSIDGKRYIASKNIIYGIINKAWNGVSFLNPQTKEKDNYVDYKEYFVDTALDYLHSSQNTYKCSCFICDRPMKNLNNDLSFLNATGFDVNRKSSHVWNFQNDIAICPLCKLVYSCLPAGMTYVYNQGIYVNANIDIQDAVKINYKIKNDILRSQEGNTRSVYHAMVAALHEQESDTASYELADVQVVRYENEAYRFNLLSRKKLTLIMVSKEKLNLLLKANYTENGMKMYIYDEVISRIFNNQNLFTLIHRMLHAQVSDPAKCYFRGGHVHSTLEINQKILRNLGGIKMNEESDLVKRANIAGYKLGEKYKIKEAANKINGICYRLLNALKTSNVDMFMDVILNCYLYAGMQVPKVITDVLGQDEDFNTMGYSFVSGLINGKDEKENAEKKN